MKTNYLITKDATKYWKKAIKNDRVMVTNHGGIIYIVNGYNAFKFPAMPLLWDELARPAFMVDMPEEGAAFQYIRGEKQAAISADVARLIDRNLSDTTAASRSPFTFENSYSLRLYTNENGSIIAINALYDAMVDTSSAEKIYCGGRYSPVVFVAGEFTALIMPVKLADSFQRSVMDTFKKIMEA